MSYNISLGYKIYDLGNLLTKFWEKKEKFFGYVWGTDGLKENEVEREGFVPYKTGELIFNYPKSSRNCIKKYFQYFISFLFLLFSCGISFLTVYLLFMLKTRQINNYKTEYSTTSNYMFNNQWPIITAFLNAIFINIYCKLFYFVSEYLNELENHKKDTDYDTSLLFKIFSFDFFNNFIPLVYIVFLKLNLNGFCDNDNCFTELSLHIYTILLTNILLSFIEFGFP